jgi:hypothetical protein
MAERAYYVKCIIANFVLPLDFSPSELNAINFSFSDRAAELGGRLANSSREPPPSHARAFRPASC